MNALKIIAIFEDDANRNKSIFIKSKNIDGSFEVDSLGMSKNFETNGLYVWLHEYDLINLTHIDDITDIIVK